MVTKVFLLIFILVTFFIINNQIKILKKRRKNRKFYLITEKLYLKLKDKYGKNGCLDFTYNNFNLIFPIYTHKEEIECFIVEFVDFVLPVLPFEIFDKKEKKEILKYCCREYSYFYKEVMVNEGDIVIDGGAHMGIFSALASALGGRVYAFEPISEMRERYLSKIAELNKNIYIIPYALSNRDGQIEIEIPNFGNSISAFGTSSIIRKFQNSRKEKIETITIDKFVEKNNIKRIDFIKADIEGAERLMLQGAYNVLKNFAPKLSICTYHLPDDKKVLTELILKANPNYKIIYGKKKLYAYV